MAVERTTEHDRVALQSETLYAVIGVVASSPDLDRVLEGVVDLLTEATHCHACFVYLRDGDRLRDRKSTRLNSSHPSISYAVFCLKKKKKKQKTIHQTVAQTDACRLECWSDAATK